MIAKITKAQETCKSTGNPTAFRALAGLFNEFVSETVNNMSQLVKKWESNGSLKELLELNKKL